MYGVTLDTLQSVEVVFLSFKGGSSDSSSTSSSTHPLPVFLILVFMLKVDNLLGWGHNTKQSYLGLASVELAPGSKTEVGVSTEVKVPPRRKEPEGLLAVRAVEAGVS